MKLNILKLRKKWKGVWVVRYSPGIWHSTDMNIESYRSNIWTTLLISNLALLLEIFKKLTNKLFKVLSGLQVHNMPYWHSDTSRKSYAAKTVI